MCRWRQAFALFALGASAAPRRPSWAISSWLASLPLGVALRAAPRPLLPIKPLLPRRDRRGNQSGVTSSHDANLDLKAESMTGLPATPPQRAQVGVAEEALCAGGAGRRHGLAERRGLERCGPSRAPLVALAALCRDRQPPPVPGDAYFTRFTTDRGARLSGPATLCARYLRPPRTAQPAHPLCPRIIRRSSRSPSAVGRLQPLGDYPVSSTKH